MYWKERRSETVFHLLLDPLLLSVEEEDDAEEVSRLISVLQWLFPFVLSGGCCPLFVGCG